jgi:galactose mutarotase-like enzyme
MERICSISKESLYGIETVVLESDLLRVRILTGKGGEIYEMIYKPLKMDFLLKKRAGLRPYQERDLYKQRLSRYSELYTGGWSDVVPDRGIYEGIVLERKTAGIAATLPWDWEITEESSEKAEIKCTVLLPVFPLYLEKFISIQAGGTELMVRESAVNKGKSEMDVAWTQHITFGGDFLADNVAVILPVDKVFRAYDFHYRMMGETIEDYEDPACSVHFREGETYNFLMAPPYYEEKDRFVTMRNLKESQASLYRQDKNIGVRLTWDAKAYPYLRYWCDNRDDSYTLALEPANHFFVDFEDSKKFGTYWTMPPGDMRSLWVNCKIFTK